MGDDFAPELRHVNGARRFSQAIAEGDGISLVAEVADLEAARAAEEHGAEGVALRSPLDGDVVRSRHPYVLPHGVASARHGAER